jgi:hypothetical protein
MYFHDINGLKYILRFHRDVGASHYGIRAWLIQFGPCVSRVILDVSVWFHLGWKLCLVWVEGSIFFSLYWLFSYRLDPSQGKVLWTLWLMMQKHRFRYGSRKSYMIRMIDSDDEKSGQVIDGLWRWKVRSVEIMDIGGELTSYIIP